MGLYKIFKDAFYDVMTRHGFIHQGNVFLRIVNGEILQAVTVKPIVGYSIECQIFPLFAPPSFPSFQMAIYQSKNPYWAEGTTMEFERFEGFPYATPIREEIDGDISYYSLEPYFQKSEEKTVANLNKAAEIMEQFYLPQFDKITDFESYLKWKALPREESGVSCHDIGDMELLYKAYLDGNFDWGNAYLAAKRENRLEFVRKEAYKNRNDEMAEEIFRAYGIRIPTIDDPEKYIAEQMSRYDGNQVRYYKRFYKAQKDGDLSWVPEAAEKEKEKMLEIFKQKYSKLFK